MLVYTETFTYAIGLLNKNSVCSIRQYLVVGLSAAHVYSMIFSTLQSNAKSSSGFGF